MSLRRISTRSFGLTAAAQLENGRKLAEALSLPMFADILETMDHHDGARFFIVAPVQVGKSAIGQCRLARNHYIRPRPAGWYGPTDDFIKDFVDTKLNPLLAAHPDIALITPTDKYKVAKLRAAYVAGSHLMLSAATENDRTGKTFCDIYLDEPHLYGPGWIEQISNRRRDYAEEFTETFMSTGLTTGDQAIGGEGAAIWATTDQRLWHVRCPSCRRLFEPRYLHRERDDDPESPISGGLRYERKFLETGLPDESAIAASLAYECPRCHARLPDLHGSRVALSGTMERPHGLYLAQNATPAAASFGWNFSAIAVRPWLPIVLRFERAQLARARGDLEPLAKCIREEFAGLWNPEAYLREKKIRPIGTYSLGEDWPDEARDPAGRPVRCATIDVQIDHFVLIIRAWAKNGASRLRWCEKVTTPSRIRDLCMEHGVIPERVYLDARHEPDYVKRTAAVFGWRVLLGEKDKDYLHTATGLRRIFSEPRMVDAYAGTAHGEGKIAQFMFSKQSALSRLHLIRTLPTPDGSPLWTAAANAPEWYFKEIDAHYRTKKRNPDGQEYWTWEGWKEDHAGDCEAMQIVFASMAGLIGGESLETAAEAPKQSA
jgi:hypothetical protein